MRTLLTLIVALLAACMQFDGARECFTDECLQCVDNCLQPSTPEN